MELLNLLEVAKRMVDTSKLNDFIAVEEFDIRLEGAAVIGEILSTKDRFMEPWGTLTDDHNHEGAHATRDGYVDFLMYLTERRTIITANADRGVNKVVATSNQASEVLKMTSQEFRKLGEKTDEYFKWPNPDSMAWDAAFKAWGLDHPPGDSVDGIFIIIIF